MTERIDEMTMENQRIKAALKNATHRVETLRGQHAREIETVNHLESENRTLNEDLENKIKALNRVLEKERTLTRAHEAASASVQKLDEELRKAHASGEKMRLQVARSQDSFATEQNRVEDLRRELNSVGKTP